MPIFDQGYQHWQGKLSSRAWRWLTITQQGVRAQLRSRWIRLLLLVAWVPALVLAAFLIIWGLVEQQAYAVLLDLFRGLPAAIRDAPRDFREPMWTLAYHYFFRAQFLFCMIVVGLVGPGLISQDLRFNAIPLYLSRPLRRLDYFVGKLGVIAVFLAAVAIVPPLVAYLLGVAFSMDLSIVPQTIRFAGVSLLYGLIVVLSAGMLMLAISSLSRNSRYVAIIWFGLWLVSGTVSSILTETIRADWCPIVSYQADLLRISETLLGSEAAFDKIQSAARAAQNMATPMVRMAPRGRRGGDPSQPPPGMRQRRPEPVPPWHWSAGILCGLFGLSLCTLTTRVKSLDRLR